MNMGLHVGLKKVQLEQILSIIESDVGKKEADAGRRVLSEVTASKEK
jgi:4-carboxymuconolactone decarboxylase